MPRHARFVLPGVPLHVRQRGIDRADCFVTEDDRELYLGLLAELSLRCACRVHAYCLMPNHVHLLFTPEQARDVAVFMKHLGQRYTQYFNRTHGRIGPLWDGRYRSSLVDSESYLLECYRYIELNPVRAEIVASPLDYPWSSYATNALGAPSIFVQAHPVYEALGMSPEERRSCYRELAGARLSDEQLTAIRIAIDASAALGSPAFVERMAAVGGQSARAIPRGRPRLVLAASDGQARLPELG